MKNVFLLFLFTTAFCCVSCSNSDKQNVLLLDRAKSIVETNPKQALVLLDSICDAEKMGDFFYMRYIVANTQARYKTNKDISGDSLIFVAQKFFEHKNFHQDAALADLYTGSVYWEKGISNLALLNYYKAEQRAKLAGDYLLVARSQHNIGFVYNEQRMADSTILYLGRALESCDKAEDIGTLKLQTMQLLANSYYMLKDKDSAYDWYLSGLELAVEMGDIEYQSVFNFGIGYLFKSTDGTIALTYFHKALQQSTDSVNTFKLYLNLAETYLKINRLDSAQYYLDQIALRGDTKIDKYTQEYMYSVLLQRSMKANNAEEALRYKLLVSSVVNDIAKDNTAKKLLEAHAGFKIYLGDMEAKHRADRLFLAVIIIVITILLFWLLSRFRDRGVEIKHERVRFTQDLQIQKNSEMDKLSKLRSKYETKIDKGKIVASKIEEDLRKQQAESSAFLLDIQRAILTDWAILETKLQLLLSDAYITDKMKENIDTCRREIKEKTDAKLYQWAEESVRSLPIGEKVIQNLEGKDLLLFLLCNNKYSDDEIFMILNLDAVKLLNEQVKILKMLVDAGLDKEEVKKYLYTNKN